MTLTAEQRKALRAKFSPSKVSWRPVITCQRCRDAAHCKLHTWETCAGCGATTSIAHTHVPYLAQEHVRERLDKVDPEWSWEPMAHTAEGQPVVDAHGGLWIWLTVCGVRKRGYGAPERDRGPNINDAINRAIRFTARDEFGVGLYLVGQTRDTVPGKPTTEAATAAELTEPPPAQVPPQAEDVPLPFDDTDREKLLAEVQEFGKQRGVSIPALAEDFLGFSGGMDLTDLRVPPDMLLRFLEYLRHPEPAAVPS